MNTPNRERAAAEIIRQLGGTGRLTAMIGIHSAIHGSDERNQAWLSFRFKGSRAANYVKVTLTSSDLYDVAFMKIHGLTFAAVAQHEAIPVEGLARVFEQTTGLRLSL